MSKPNRLIYLPLGGAGEIGMNMYLYGYGPRGKERFILVDVGVAFPSMDTTPGVDLIMADTGYIEARADRLEAIFITHAHEDHVGAIGHLFSRLGVPIYCRKFTAAVTRTKMEDRGQDTRNVNVVGLWPEQVEVGPFKVGFMPVAHSIPEASGLVIDSPVGRVIHSGDFKLDPDPIVGEPHNPALLREIAGQGVHALICDSTNVFSPLAGRSESTLRSDISALIKQSTGMMVATTFASNVARLKTLAQAGVDAGRSVVVLGRAMSRMLDYARFAEVLHDFPPVIDLEDSRDIPRENLMLLVTGSQGEGRAASAQLARGKYRGVELRDGDTFLFSSKTIPGNETSVGGIINAMAEIGVKVLDESVGNVHVSGHANRPDLVEMHNLMRPKMVIPNHGEFRHLREHKELAQSNGFASVVAPNGTMVDITGTTPKIVEHIEAGRTYLDGSVLIGAFDGVVLERIRMATRGAVAVNVILENNRMIGGCWAEVMGLPDKGANAHVSLQESLENVIDQELETAKPSRLASDDEVENIVMRAVSRSCRDLVGKKPVCKVMINRLVDE